MMPWSTLNLAWKFLKTSGQDILRQRNIGKELRGEAVMKKLVGNMVGAKGGQNWPSETFTTDTEASIHATKVLEDKHLATSPSLHPNETPWFDDGWDPRIHYWNRTAPKPLFQGSKWEARNFLCWFRNFKQVCVCAHSHKVTKHWIQTEFEQRGVETMEKNEYFLFFFVNSNKNGSTVQFRKSLRMTTPKGALKAWKWPNFFIVGEDYAENTNNFVGNHT